MNANPNPMVLAMAEEIRPQVFTVIVAKKRDGDAIVGSGSSFVINTRADGSCALLTCIHVITGEENYHEQIDRIYVRRPSENGGVQQLSAKLLWSDPNADLAILEVDGPIQGAQALNFAPASAVPIGDSAIAVGYCTPQAYIRKTSFTKTAAVSPGVLKSLETDANGTPIEAVLSCVGMQGMSGGPVMCNDGVFAVVSNGEYIRATGRHLETYAISSEKIQEVIRDWLNLPESDVWALNDLVTLL